MIRSLPPLLCCGALALITGAANGNIVYQETFPFTRELTQDAELRNQGWCGGNAGDAFCNNPQVPGPGSPNQGGEGAISASPGSTVTPSLDINNNPQGPLAVDAFAFWSQTGTNAQSFMYTQEYMLDVAMLDAVMWDQRDSSADAMHLAFRILDDWYISEQTFTQPDASQWIAQSASLASLSFFQIDGGGDQTILPGGDSGPLFASLPAGTINAFGVWWDSDKTHTSRIDNFKLVAAEAPLPGTLWLVGGALAGMAGMRRLRAKP
ncbi:VPLPA-CTERM sorting domain-containing protein [uncultured Thiohalocapsa sp.]|uniref:VPLPA-CTERM sorting domain-containing protein n=1 Tax=uncultured Thiohalocapsa sp. TaxID=768990 RepID=UPI0026002461|nr:VPLPA-CTERM sorting domain-containing protein [uncultured Thiohalocapsa sp.]